MCILSSLDSFLNGKLSMVYSNWFRRYDIINIMKVRLPDKILELEKGQITECVVSGRCSQALDSFSRVRQH